MKLSENQECQVEFDSIVSWVEGIFPVGAVPCGCPLIDNTLIVKVSTDVKCNIRDAANIARKLRVCTSKSL
ncbi:hypothetical protein J4G07_19130 [Candidatus Poribacteria bacterium]|nr:hypothetical protein [Candidatus Poribacteria bacterium]